ncbi:MAG: thioredoxin fold domain-containing protein [Phycisphaerales bacterium]|nr:thioredoxin fold domain-containing protein [Phycisphaerales bacterium]
MLKAMRVVLAVGIAVACRADLPPAFSDLTLEAATKQVEGTDKLVLMKFTAEWCMPCKAMDQTTWRDEKVVAWVKDHGVAIQVDVDKQPKVSQSYQISAMPTMVMLRGGNEIARKTGYLDAPQTLTWMEDASSGKLAGGPKVDRESKDMMARLRTVREVAQAGKSEEAAEEYAWLWENMVGIDPHMLGVRGSFMAMDMKALAERSADAKARFTLLREVAAAKRTADPASVEFLDDWIVLNEVIGDDDATLAWFDRVKLGEGESASETKMLGGVSFRIVELLLAKDRLADVVRLYPDPLAEIRSDFELSAEMARRQPALPDFLDEATKESVRAQPWEQFREKVAVLYAGFLAAGKDEKAAEIMAEARKLYDRPRLVTGVIGFAVERGQARRAMNGLLDDAEKAGADVKELRAKLEAALADRK